MLLEQVREGMTVSDAEGKEIGTVELIKMADPDAVIDPEPPEREEPPVIPVPGPGFLPGSTGATATGGAGPMAAGMPAGAAPVGPAVGIGGEPDVPEEIAPRLRRTGYVKVDTKGLFRRDVYVSATEIDAVADDTVRLNVAKNELVKEA